MRRLSSERWSIAHLTWALRIILRFFYCSVSWIARCLASSASPKPKATAWRSVGLALIVGIVFFSGCWSSSGPEVVVYSALDREFSEPLLDQFSQQTGIRVLAAYDVESNKTVGWYYRLLAESRRPRCDLFWNNEILHTLRLQQQGLLDVYLSPARENYPVKFYSRENQWHGFAARARVFIVNKNRVSTENEPRSIHDLVDQRWHGQVGIAKPLFGTSSTHAACLFAYWGSDRAKDFFRKLKRNAIVLPGNRQVAAAVAGGELAWGMTDTDDAMIELERGMPVRIVFPDQGPQGIGTLLIPNTLALMRGSPQPENARKLVDYLLSPVVETQLAQGRSAQFPLNRLVRQRSRAETAEEIRWMDVDFPQAAEQWEEVADFLRKEF